MILSFLIGLLILTTSAAKHPLPPGMVQVGENLYADIQEVNILDWVEYQYYSQLGEDSVLTKAFDNGLSRMQIGAHSAPVHQYPMHLLTFEEAQAYCTWRTAFVNKHHYQSRGMKVIFRLPTEAEFKLMLTYEEVAFTKRIKKVKKLVSTAKTEEGFNGLYSQVKRRNNGKGMPKGLKKNRLYGLFSNVAEMSDEKGVAFGMTNDSFNTEGNQMPTITYDGPSKSIGFRCVAEFVYKE